MKKSIATILVFVMVLTLMPAGALAQEGEELTVQTRSSKYVFHVGDTFTYSYWLSLKPDVVNYSEDYLKELIGISFSGDKELAGLKLSNLTNLTLKSVSGNIKYDTNCLSLVSATTPNIKRGLTKQKPDAMGGTILDGTLFDFTNADLAFFSNIMSKNEKAQFNEPKVLVSCTFRVIHGSATPVYLRTKLTHLEVTTQKIGNIVDKQDIKLVHGRTAFFPYESFETVNDEEPSIVLKSLVDDVGLDIRYLNISSDLSQYKRPGAGVTATMMGFSSDARYLKLQQQTDGSEVLWFYDVPYGQYYVDCSFTDESGRFFATPDPGKAEHINVPATGEIQALWLIQTQPSETKQIHVYVDWVGDEGYLPARPEYLHLQLYNEQDVTGLVLQQQLLERSDTSTSFDSVNINDRSGNPISYKLIVSAQGDSYAWYDYEVEQRNNDFYITATYIGSPEDLGKIPVDQGGHYWIEVERTEPSCTLDGKAYYVCDVCHETKYITIPAKGHTMATIPGKPASCTTAGETEGSYCTICGKIIKYQQVIPATGHSYTANEHPATCTEQGYTMYTCACGDSYKNNYTDALGHSWDEGKVTKQPTETSEGERTYTCTRCSETKAETISPLTHEHHYSAAITRPTCTEKGYTTYTCSCGDSYKDNYVKAMGHNYKDGVCTSCGADDPSYTVKPAAPAIKLVNVASTGKIKITWSKVSGATKYEIYRATAKTGTYTKLGTTSGTSFTNTSAKAGKTYYYKVKAIAADGTKSGYSAIKSLTCDLARPTVKIALSSGHPKLSWAKVDGATKYEVYRATSKTGTYSKLTSTAKTSYVNTKATKGKTYYYKVKAVCNTSSAASAYSTVVSIKAK